MSRTISGEAPPAWSAWFDGAAAPNPGKIGVGVVLVAPDGARTEQSLALGRTGCNNEAELRALAIALELARAAGARHIEIRGDSKATADWINGADSTAIEPLAGLVADICVQLRQFDDARVVWIPRHKNREADQLSRRALGLTETASLPTKKRRNDRR